MEPKRTHIHRDIADGEVFRHEGPVTLHGNVGKGARIEIVDGGIKIKGDVGDNATVRTRGQGGMQGGIVITGMTGTGVVLDSDLGVSINAAGDHVRVRSGDALAFGKVGILFNAVAGENIVGGDLGQNARLRCKGSCAIGSAGEGSMIDSEGPLQMTFAGHDSRIACFALHAASLGADTIATANERALVGAAHVSAKISAKSVQIRETFKK